MVGQRSVPPGAEKLIIGGLQRLPGADNYMSKADVALLLIDSEIEKNRQQHGGKLGDRSTDDDLIARRAWRERAEKVFEIRKEKSYLKTTNTQLTGHHSAFTQVRKAALAKLLETEQARHIKEIQSSRRRFRPDDIPDSVLPPVPGLPQLPSPAYLREHPDSPRTSPCRYDIRDPIPHPPIGGGVSSKVSRLRRNPFQHMMELRNLWPNMGITADDRIEIERTERRKLMHSAIRRAQQKAEEERKLLQQKGEFRRKALLAAFRRLGDMVIAANRMKRILRTRPRASRFSICSPRGSTHSRESIGKTDKEDNGSRKATVQSLRAPGESSRKTSAQRELLDNELFRKQFFDI